MLNLQNFIQITKLTTVEFFNSWYSFQCFESKLGLIVSIILSGYLLPYLLSMLPTKIYQCLFTSSINLIVYIVTPCCFHNNMILNCDKINKITDLAIKLQVLWGLTLVIWYLNITVTFDIPFHRFLLIQRDLQVECHRSVPRKICPSWQKWHQNNGPMKMR